MADLYLRNPKSGEVEVFDEADGQAAANAGYTAIDQTAYAAARKAEAQQTGLGEGVASGLLEAPADYDQTSAFAEKVYSGLTFGQGEQINSPEARARGLKYQEEHPYASMAGEALGQAPYTVMAGAAGAGLRGAAAAGTAAARAGAFGADLALSSAVGGAQIEGERARLAGDEFSFTDAALAGVTTEVLGRSAAWGIAKGVGGARNLLARAERTAVAADAERSLSKGGWVNDYRVAAHAEAYHDELADLAAKDLDTLETSFEEVSRQDRKRARIQRAVVENPPAQHSINVQALSDLQTLRTALTSELEDAPAGPAKRLAKHLDDRIAALEEAPKGKKLWRALDENRQALQEYRQDLYQAYDTNPGSAWLSRDGLSAIDRAEEATRNALLREDAWGEAAARMQREYNTPFHEKWFPARGTVLKDLHFQTGRDAKGFPVFRGEPGKVKKFLTSLTGTSPDVHRARELFAQYLDGAAAVAKTGERDAPAAARRVQEATRRLRKAIANAQAVSGAAERTATRTAGVDVGAGVAAAGVGAAVAGPMGLVAGPVARGFHLAEWLGRASKKLGLFAGDRLSMEKLLAEGALSELGNTEGHEVAGRLADDLLDGTPPTPPAPAGFRPTPPPAGPGAAVRGERGVALEGAGPRTQRPEYRVAERVDARMEPGFKDTRPGQAEVLPEAFNVYEAPGGAGAERATAHPGVGQARRAAADRPAGMEAIQPQPRPRSVGAEPPVAGRPSFEPGESDIPSIRDGSEVPLANPDTPPPLGADALAGEFETVSAPYHTEGMSESEKALAPGAAARSAEAARLQALTEGEFKDIVDQLGATGSDEARAIAKTLWANKDKLAAAGLLVASGVDALTGEPGDPNVAGASAGVLGAALLLGKRAPGAWFAAARPEMQKALGGLERLGFETTPAHVAMLAKTFGDRVPSEAVLQKMIPLGELEKLAPRGEAPRLVKVGGAVHWYAEGVSTVHPEWGFEAPTWKMARTFERAPDGELIVHHDYFYLREDLQGTGAGAKILKDQMEAYRELGVDLVEVSCDDVGKYFWPSIGFNHPDPRVVQKAVNAYQNWVVQNKLALPSEVAAEAATIKSLPRLAQAEFGKDFLLAKPGEWNLHLEMKLSESNPLFHLMSQRLSLQDAGLGAAGLALAGAIDGSKPEGVDEPAPGAALAPFLVFGRRASMLKGARARLVADVAKRLFTSSAPAAARVVTRLVYSRSEMAKRQQEFETWQANPQELVDRVAEGFREVPPEQAAEVNAGVFRAASFLKARLPRALKASPVSMRAIPVSTEQLHKFARYEQAALAPRDALQEAAHAGHLSTELLETLDELYPDLLAETRVAAYQAVREDGPPPTVQARLAYAQLFDGNGEMADPAFGAEVARMSAYAYENAPPAPKGSAPSTAHVSQVAAANARPAGLARLG